MLSESMVTAPVFAKAPPQPSDTPVLRVMLVLARMLPSNPVPVPRVAELPTTQYTAAFAPTSDKVTVVLDPVMSVDGIRKTHSSLALPLPCRVTVPVKLPPATAATE
jgi:hypothetical protein